MVSCWLFLEGEDLQDSEVKTRRIKKAGKLKWAKGKEPFTL